MLNILDMVFLLKTHTFSAVSSVKRVIFSEQTPTVVAHLQLIILTLIALLKFHYIVMETFTLLFATVTYIGFKRIQLRTMWNFRDFMQDISMYVFRILSTRPDSFLLNIQMSWTAETNMRLAFFSCVNDFPEKNSSFFSVFMCGLKKSNVNLGHHYVFQMLEANALMIKCRQNCDIDMVWF